MTTRKLYSEELVQLSESLEEMGNLVEASLKNLFFSIENKDMQLAERIVADDRNVNNLERSIEAQCLMLITTQQPIAQDLRTVSSILKVVTDIERIGDHASDIAELIQQMDHKQLERYSGHLQPMIAASREMVHEAVSAFVARDQKKANDVIASDDIIDKLFDKVKNDIVIHIKEDRSDAIESLDALMLAKYLERIGDHAVNICEWEIFRETGTIQNTKVFLSSIRLSTAIFTIPSQFFLIILTLFQHIPHKSFLYCFSDKEKDQWFSINLCAEPFFPAD